MNTLLAFDNTPTNKKMLLENFNRIKMQLKNFPDSRFKVRFVFCRAVIFFAVFFLLSTNVHAADITVSNGQLAGQQSLNDGDTLTVNQGGVVIVSGGGVDAVVDAVDGITVSVNNSGSIFSNGGRGIDVGGSTLIGNNSGVITGGDDGVLATTIQSFTNSGTITSINDGVEATTIQSFTNSGTISSRDGVDALSIDNLTNSGTITGTDDGIEAGSIGNLNNSGSIFANGKGIESTGTIQNLTNSGIIIGNDDGVDTTGAIGNFTNSGTITGGADDGVGAGLGIQRLTNSGTITGTDSGVDMSFGTIINSGLIQGTKGIEADRVAAGNASVTNSGIIRSVLGPAGIAIDFLGVGDDSLTLLDDYIIVGAINLGAGTDTVNYLPGHSSVLTFDSVPEVINSNNPVFTNGSQVAVLDPTAVSLADDISADLTTNIGIIVSRQARRSGRFQARSSRKVLVASTQLVALPAPDQKKYSSWFEGFGGYKDRKDDGHTLGATTHFAGGMAGIDKQTADDNRFGLFFGGSYSNIDVNSNSQELDVYSYYGGIYSGHRFGLNFIDTSLTIGAMNFNSDRSFANNIVPGGLENANADYMGFFINPQVTISRTVPTSKEFSVVPSLRVGYTGLFIENYQEAGSSANLSVGSRDLHLLYSRIQFAFRFETDDDKLEENPDEGHWNSELFAGLDGRLNLGDEAVDATLIGQTISFDPGGDDEVLRGFAGLSLIYSPTDTITLSARAEAGAGTDKSFYATGKIRATFRF